jgi:hypothetical protein
MNFYYFNKYATEATRVLNKETIGGVTITVQYKNKYSSYSIKNEQSNLKLIHPFNNNNVQNKSISPFINSLTIPSNNNNNNSNFQNSTNYSFPFFPTYSYSNTAYYYPPLFSNTSNTLLFNPYFPLYQQFPKTYNKYNCDYNSHIFQQNNNIINLPTPKTSFLPNFTFFSPANTNSLNILNLTPILSLISNYSPSITTSNFTPLNIPSKFSSQVSSSTSSSISPSFFQSNHKSCPPFFSHFSTSSHPTSSQNFFSHSVSKKDNSESTNQNIPKNHSDGFCNPNLSPLILDYEPPATQQLKFSTLHSQNFFGSFTPSPSLSISPSFSPSDQSFFSSPLYNLNLDAENL